MAIEPGDANFQSKLDERSRKRARDELNELNDKDRELAVQTLRQWVLEQKWLRTPTDFEFLLRFLRARKFSQLLARESLENYWTVRTRYPDWFRDVDPTEPKVQAILRSGALIAPKVYDKEGRRVLIEPLRRLDMDAMKRKGGVDSLFRAVCMLLDWLSLDENVQVNGLVIFVDYTDFSVTDVMSLMSTENTKRIFQYYQNALPGRMKGHHEYNEPPTFDLIFNLISPFMKQKTKDRMRFHGRSMVKAYEEIGPEVFPVEYLPDDYKGKTVGTIESCVEEMITDMNTPEFLSYIKDLSSDKYGVDLKDKDKNAPVASFRKLNVD